MWKILPKLGTTDEVYTLITKLINSSWGQRNLTLVGFTT
jgi:hypothetical protein